MKANAKLLVQKSGGMELGMELRKANANPDWKRSATLLHLLAEL